MALPEHGRGEARYQAAPLCGVVHSRATRDRVPADGCAKVSSNAVRLDEAPFFPASAAGCVAFNTHGWLKNSTADMAPGARRIRGVPSMARFTPPSRLPHCRLVRPVREEDDPAAVAHPPAPDILLAHPHQRLLRPLERDRWVRRCSQCCATSVLESLRSPAVSPALAYTVTPAAASAAVLAYAKHINDVVFMNTPASPLPAGALATVNIVIANPNVPLQLGVDEVGRGWGPLTARALSSPAPPLPSPTP